MTELQPSDGQITAGALVVFTENVGTKRQRRPSVRLGDIGGDQSSDSHLNLRRSNKSQHTNKDNHKSNSSAKSKTLVKLSGSEFDKALEIDDKEGKNLDCVAIGSWKVGDGKSKQRSSGITKRVRSNRVSKIGGDDDVDEFSGGDVEFRDLDNSESLAKGNSHHVNSLGIEREEDDDFRKGISRARVLDGGRVELDGPLQQNDHRNWRHGGGRVVDWLIELGLGQYAPVFEIHEVDGEVLPMLTLDDLKDMGINAVGSRRKMYSSIQKLRKSFQ